MNEKVLIKIVNKYDGRVGYDVPDLGIHRDFYPNEVKEVTFQEIEKLSYMPGGSVILKEYLEIQDKEAAEKVLHFKPEPEYHYSIEDVKQIMKNGTLDQFLDCLDFAPEVIKETIKELAVTLPLNDMQKREAVKEKLGLDVTKAIEIKNTKSDEELEGETFGRLSKNRRVAVPTQKKAPTPTGRRYVPENK